MTTLKEIALEANVSVSTASRALNDSHLVNDETKRRVREVAEKLNYIPNLNAASLRTGRSDIIVYAVPRLDTSQDALHLQILGQIERYAALQNHKILLVTYNDDETIRNIINTIGRDSRTGGMLLFGDVFSEERINIYRTARFPLVIMNAYPDEWEKWDDIACVGVDNLEAGYIATRHLAELGHRNIVWMGNTNSREGLQRREGFRRALEEANLYFDKFRVLHVRPGLECDDAARATHTLLSEWKESPTAFVSGDDLISLGIIKSARAHGRNIPEDISVVGFGNTNWTDFTEPTLSTVDTKVTEMGKCAADLLLRLMNNSNGSSQSNQYMLRPDLIVRGSTAPIIK